MKSKITKTFRFAGLAVLLLAASAIMGKSQNSIAPNDGYFEPDEDKLQTAPAEIAVVRPTHFSDAAARIRRVHSGESLARIVGRNVTFRDLIAEAYDCSPGCVALPPDAPTGGFDFLVTFSPRTRQHLRDAIKKDLGYAASSEMRDTEVLVLRVSDPALPGLSRSASDQPGVDYRDGRLYFTHQPLSVLLKGLEDGLALPVVDKTGLTNNYDFSVTWNQKTTEEMRNGGFSLDGARKVLNGWGLDLVPDTARLNIFTVKKTD